MPEVKVRRQGIPVSEASAAIRDALGQGCQITETGDGGLDVRRNFFIRAKVSMREEPGGTVFHVRGAGVPIPLLFTTMMAVNSRGIGRQIADAIGSCEEFRGDG